MWRKMQNTDIKPGDITYNIVTKACADRGHWEEDLEVLKAM